MNIQFTYLVGYYKHTSDKQQETIGAHLMAEHGDKTYLFGAAMPLLSVIEAIESEHLGLRSLSDDELAVFHKDTVTRTLVTQPVYRPFGEYAALAGKEAM